MANKPTKVITVTENGKEVPALTDGDSVLTVKKYRQIQAEDAKKTRELDDITNSLCEAQEEKDLALNELHHAKKNKVLWKIVAGVLIVVMAAVLAFAAAMDAQSNNYTDEILKQMDIIQAENEALRNQNSALQTENDALENENAELESENDVLEDANAKLESENDVLEDTNAKLESENDALEGTNSELESENDALEEENDALESENEELRKENEALKDKLNQKDQGEVQPSNPSEENNGNVSVGDSDNENTNENDSNVNEREEGIPTPEW